jgi:hypothetical protein
MRRAIHVHLHRTGDGQPSMADLYRDLAERMWNALQEFKLHGHVTRDDLQGHAFHGNQWTGGINGPHKEKPTKEHLAAHKGGFSKMHALLSSGHKFSKQEMIDLAGLAGEKKLTDYLAMLKNPKYAGSKGALKIEKDKDGMYFVAMPDGTPAPPIDGIKEGNDLTEHMHGHDPAEDLNAALHAHLIEPPKKTTLPPHLEKVIAKQPSHTVNEVHVPGFTDPPAPAPAAPPAPALTGLSALTAAHPGSMTKEQADKHYQEAVDHAYADLAQMAKAGIGGPLLQETVLKFKNAKAAGMAGWATAVHGHAYAPKPQQVYKADVQLAEDAKVFSKAAALNNWKANTAAEKHGNFPPKPVTAPVTKATTHTPGTGCGHGARRPGDARGLPRPRPSVLCPDR